MFPRPFRRHGAVPLAIYSKGDTIDTKEMHTVFFFFKVMPLKCYRGRTGRGYDIILNAAGVVVNNQIKGEILATRRNVQTPIKHSL